MKKVLLDFDIGTEVDDAIALAYLLANPECELVGITTSCGEAVARAEMASMLCKMAGKDVPIHPGCEIPIFIPQMETTAPQTRALKHWPHDTGYERYSAIPFMQKVIRENPGEIILLATAPMTNLGILFTMDPEIPSLLGGLYLMCGSPTHHRYDIVSETHEAIERDDLVRELASQGILENNSIIDPHATNIVYRARCKDYVNICNNVSSRAVMKPEQAEKLFTHPIMQVVMSIAREWFKDEPIVSFHDAIAAVSIFHPEIFTFKRGYLDCVMDSKLLAGLTTFRENPNGPHKVAWTVDVDRFYDALFGVFQ